MLNWQYKEPQNKRPYFRCETEVGVWRVIRVSSKLGWFAKLDPFDPDLHHHLMMTSPLHDSVEEVKAWVQRTEELIPNALDAHARGEGRGHVVVVAPPKIVQDEAGNSTVVADPDNTKVYPLVLSHK